MSNGKQNIYQTDRAVRQNIGEMNFSKSRDFGRRRSANQCTKDNIDGLDTDYNRLDAEFRNKTDIYLRPLSYDSTDTVTGSSFGSSGILPYVPGVSVGVEDSSISLNIQVPIKIIPCLAFVAGYDPAKSTSTIGVGCSADIPGTQFSIAGVQVYTDPLALVDASVPRVKVGIQVNVLGYSDKFELRKLPNSGINSGSTTYKDPYQSTIP